jgi:hypothetical protein
MQIVMMLAMLAADPAQLFVETVLPVLKRDCMGCHGEGQTISKLDLRTREGMLKGGVRGAAIVPGKASTSLLYRFVVNGGAQQMPPGKHLAPEVLAAIGAWIDGGAPWKEVSGGPVWNFAEADLWALRPVKKGVLRLPAGGKAVDARTLVRRVTFDLTGCWRRRGMGRGWRGIGWMWCGMRIQAGIQMILRGRMRGGIGTM